MKNTIGVMDTKSNQTLFLPSAYRDEAVSFIENNTVTKEEIGRKMTGDGLIALTN